MRRWLGVAAGLLAVGAVSVAAVSVPGCSEKVSRLQLIVDEPQGFLCVEDADPDKLLIERAFDQSPPAFSVVVDFLRLGGVPGCRVQELLNWCEDHPCTPIAEHRVCVDADLAGVPRDVSEALEAIGEQLAGTIVNPDAPQEPVLIRVVAVAQPCSEVPTSGDLNLTCDRLMGCAYTCPVVLGEVDGQVILDLDVVGNDCEQAVEVCSSADGFRIDNVCD